MKRKKEKLLTEERLLTDEEVKFLKESDIDTVDVLDKIAEFAPESFERTTSLYLEDADIYLLCFSKVKDAIEKEKREKDEELRRQILSILARR